MPLQVQNGLLVWEGKQATTASGSSNTTHTCARALFSRLFPACPPTPLPLLLARMCTGDHGVIAKETARTLGLGTNIQDANGLPTLDADGKVPKDLGKKYGKMILEADGFAQVCCVAGAWLGR